MEFKEIFRTLTKSVPGAVIDMFDLELKVARFDKDRMFQPFVRATDGSAGYDIFSIERINLDPGESVVTHTNLITEIPRGWVGVIVPRSGFGFKYGVRLANTVGVIDSDFRGEILVKLSLPSECKQTLSIPPGERYCQMLVLPAPMFKVTVCDISELSSTKRGDGGTGSTGTSREDIGQDS